MWSRFVVGLYVVAVVTSHSALLLTVRVESGIARTKSNNEP